MNRLLTICKPTYNRIQVLASDIKDYLALQDERFCIKVNDNNSTDDTIPVLSNIKDKRLIVNKNPVNLGTMRNGIAALKGAKSKYIMLLLDKDTIDMRVFPLFLDYLEKEEPYFGYVDLNINSPIYIENFQPGIESIIKVAYLSKHPSGFFWRADIFDEEIIKPNYDEYQTFDFIYDLINGSLAVKYPGTIVHIPLVINANIRSSSNCKLYSNKGSYGYDASNIYFGKEKRLLEFETYLKNSVTHDISKEDKCKIIAHLTYKGCSSVSTGLHSIMQNKAACDHYHLRTRNVTFIEMEKNICEILSILDEYCKEDIDRTFVNRLKTIMFVKFTYKSVECKLKSLFIRPEDGMRA